MILAEHAKAPDDDDDDDDDDFIKAFCVLD